MEPRQDVEQKKPVSRKLFLRQGQGISRFGMKDSHPKFKSKPRQKGSTPRPQDSQEGRPRSTSSPVLHDQAVSRQWKAMSPAGILAGDDSREVNMM